MATDGPVTTELGGHEFRLSLLGTTDSLEMLTRLGKVLGPALSGDLATGSSRGVAALASLFAKTDNKEISSIIRKLLAGCLIDSKPLFGPNGAAGGVYETAFRGRLALLLKVVGWAIKENFGDFTESPGDENEAATAILDAGLTSESTTPSSVS